MKNRILRLSLTAQTGAFFCLSILLLVALASSITHAQDLDNATISGRVFDGNGAVIPGAIVTAARDLTNIERTVTTDAEGRYHLIQLEPGAYTVKVAAIGFAAMPLKVVTIAAQRVQLDVTLAVADASVDPVFVTDLAPAVDTTRTIVGGTVTLEEVESLPVATRSPLDLIFTLGGVTEEPLSTRDLAEDRNQNPRGTPEEAGSFALSGGNASSNNITIDGLDNNDDRAARERFQPSLEAVAEVQVIRINSPPSTGALRADVSTYARAADQTNFADVSFISSVMNP